MLACLIRFNNLISIEMATTYTVHALLTLFIVNGTLCLPDLDGDY